LFCWLLAIDMSTWETRFWKSPVPVLGPLGRLIARGFPISIGNSNEEAYYRYCNFK
jgi:hypothetical protein